MSDVSPYPKLKPVDQNYSRKKKTYTKEEWVNYYEMELSDTYGALNNYIHDNSLPFLDNCSYIEFCDFVALKSSKNKEYYD